ncbi:MAG TPA: hypothetical protein VLY04_08095 [Bryobacteraceae bacterium]|nr:hypothetical protein [Bryobacteraceae bacterium]
MRNRSRLTTALVFCFGSLVLPATCFGQFSDGADGSSGAGAPPSSPSPGRSEGLPHFGLAVGAGTLGATIQAATAVTRRSNVRFAFNDFSYNATFNKDGVAYNGSLNLRSAEILYDQYLAGPIHISPGVMIYDGNKASGNASVPAGSKFSLGDVDYYSQAGNPLTGTGAISARKVSPMVLIGFGNLLPRSKRHFSLNFDLGVVFQGSPSATLGLAGGACTPTPAANCQNAATSSSVQANVQSEQTKINNSASVFKYYPVITLTFGYKF